MKYYIYLLFLLSPVFVHSQIDYYPDCNVRQEKTLTAELYVNKNPSLKNQFYNHWTNGTIIFSNGDTVVSKKLRYNQLEDELLWLRESDFKTGIIFKATVSSFILHQNNRNIEFINFFDSSTFAKQQIYLEVLLNQKIELFCHRKLTYVKSGNSLANKTQYYLKKDNRFIGIRLSARSVLACFNETEQKHLKEIMRKHHLKFRKEKDLAEGLQHYNSGSRF
jgi:hypothetical protein